MTDNEIIKALECCKKDRLNPRCRKCPLSQYADCQIRLEYEIFPLVNRQRAEIERLNETLDNIIRFLPACTDCEGKTPYGERTEKCVFEIDPSYCGKKAYELFVKMRTELETAKAEAIKEFAERFKELCGNDVSSAIVWAKGTIDNLVKEMEGEG